MFAVTVTSNVARCRDRGFERGEEDMREIVRIIARIMRKKRARRRSRNSTTATVSKKQGRIGTRYTSVRVTTMHSNDSNLSGNYFDSTCICIVERTRSISLSLSLFFQASLNEASVEGGTTLLRHLASYVLPKKRERIRRDFPRFHVEPDSVDMAFLDRDSPRATANLRV